MYNPYKKDFPILKEMVNGKRLVYLDNAATSQKPNVVIESLKEYYSTSNANPHRGAYDLSIKATKLLETSRDTIKNFINAEYREEIIFTKSATEAFNLLAYSYALDNINENDEIVLSIMEHHSNLVPWQYVAKAKKAKLVYLYIDKNGSIPKEEIEKKITNKTKLLAITHVSNVLGTINPIKEIITKAHKVGAISIVDLAQSVAHMKVDVQDLDADFAVFSGHKMFAPMGIGVLYGKKDILASMSPFLFGGDMIEYVSESSSTFAELPYKFEGGTQNVGGAVGLAKAISYIEDVGFNNIKKIEAELTQYALDKLNKNPYITILGSTTNNNREGVISFIYKDAHPHDIASILDASGVAIRSGHHCAHPLMKFYDINATARASFSFYNTIEDIDIFIEALGEVRRWLHLGSR